MWTILGRGVSGRFQVWRWCGPRCKTVSPRIKCLPDARAGLMSMSMSSGLDTVAYFLPRFKWRPSRAPRWITLLTFCLSFKQVVLHPTLLCKVENHSHCYMATQHQQLYRYQSDTEICQESASLSWANYSISSIKPRLNSFPYPQMTCVSPQVTWSWGRGDMSSSFFSVFLNVSFLTITKKPSTMVRSTSPKTRKWRSQEARRFKKPEAGVRLFITSTETIHSHTAWHMQQKSKEIKTHQVIAGKSKDKGEVTQVLP